MTERRRAAIIYLIVVAIGVFVALNSTRYFFRADLTEDKIFSISDVSKNLFREIPEQVHITYYLSDRLRSLTPVPGRIVDLLDEYAAYSHGKIKVTVVDPAGTDAASAAQRFGIFPQQIQVIEQNEQRVAEVYSGLVFEYLDRTIAIPFVFNPETLEYSLTLTIRRIVRDTQNVVGVLVSDDGKTLERNFSMLSGQLGLSFSVRALAAGAEIPPDVKVLVVIGGTALTREQLRPINDFVMRGGSVLFAVKGVDVATERDLSAARVGSSPLLDLLASYGVRVGRELILDRSARDYRVPQILFGQVKWQVVGRYPEWVSILPQNVSSANPITRRFPGLDLLWPSDLEISRTSGINAEVLARTTDRAWALQSPLVTDPFRVTSFDGSGSPKRQYVVACALSGSFPSFFGASDASGAAGRAGESSNAAAAARSPATRMIVVADSDFASDLMQFSDSPYNALFVENAVEWLSSDADLLSIKTRNFRDPGLDRIQDDARRGRLILLAELVNLAIVPLLVIAFGLIRGYLRRETVMAARAERAGGARRKGGAP